MPARPPTTEQLADAERLKAALTEAKRDFGLTQSDLASLCGWETVTRADFDRLPRDDQRAAERFAAWLVAQSKAT